jgi:hypothetical protein
VANHDFRLPAMRSPRIAHFRSPQIRHPLSLP